MRVRPWILALLLCLLATGLLAFSCGGGSKSKGQVNLNGIPTATLPSTLPDPLIVSGTPRPSASGRYVVQDGDNPSSIAARFGITTEELMTANGITDPTSLQVGQVLIIPAPRPTATPAP